MSKRTAAQIDSLINAVEPFSYVWTRRDADVAKGQGKGAGPEKHLVTPYLIDPRAFKGAEGYAPGDQVTVTLGAALNAKEYRTAPIFVREFFKDKMVWRDISSVPGAAEATSIKELFSALFASEKGDGRIFPKAYYGDVDAKLRANPSDLAQFIQVILGYWKNTEYHHALLEETYPANHDPSFWDRSKVEKVKELTNLKASIGGKRIRWVLANEPAVATVAVAPGKGATAGGAARPNTAQAPDVEWSVLQQDLVKIQQKTYVFNHYREIQEKVAKERSEIVPRVLGLNALLTACDLYNVNVTGSQMALAKELRETSIRLVADAAKWVGETPIYAQQKNPKDTALIKTSVPEVIQSAADDLYKLLFEDTERGARFSAWYARHAKTDFAGEEHHLAEITRTMVAAVEALGDMEQGDQALARAKKLKEILDGAADKPPSLVPVEETSPLIKIVMDNSARVQLVLALYGNLEGPPSLSIAVVQTLANWEFSQACKAALQQNTSKLGSIGTWALEFFKKRIASNWKAEIDALASRWKIPADRVDELHAVLKKEQEVWTQFTKAFQARDQKALSAVIGSADFKEVKAGFTDRVGRSFQSSTYSKLFVNVLQILAFIAAVQKIRELNYDTIGPDGFWSNANNVDIVLTLASGGTQLVQLGAGVAETALTAFGRWSNVAVSGAVPTLAKCIGAAGLIVALVSSGWDLVKAFREKKPGIVKVGIGISALGTGIMLVLIAMSSANPVGWVVGIGFTLIGPLVASVGEEEKPSPQSDLAGKIIDAADKNPEFKLLLEMNPAFKGAWEAVSAKVKKGPVWLPEVKFWDAQPFLKSYGFHDNEIAFVAPNQLGQRPAGASP